MSTGNVASSVVKGGQPVELTEGAEDVLVSNTFSISALNALNIVIDVLVEDFVMDGGVTLKLETSATGDYWEVAKSVSVGADGWVSIRVAAANPDDAAAVPLRALGRVTATSILTDTCTIAKVLVNKLGA